MFARDPGQLKVRRHPVHIHSGEPHRGEHGEQHSAARVREDQVRVRCGGADREDVPGHVRESQVHSEAAGKEARLQCDQGLANGAQFHAQRAPFQRQSANHFGP